MPRYRLIVEYDGTDFSGWQANPGRRTVQGVLSEAVSEMAGAGIRVQGASRTDAGVHARGQVATFSTDVAIPADGVRKGLNGLLPPDVAIPACDVVPEAFDPRRWAVGKHYRYRFWNRPSRSPLAARTSWYRRGPIDLELLRAAVPALLGEHDFSAFRSARCSAPSAVRHVEAIDAAHTPDGFSELDVRGNAFLHHMVRNIAGTLVEVGQGRRPPEDVGRVLRSRDRTLAGPTAPAQGLCLMSVTYLPGPVPPPRRHGTP